MAEVSLEQFSGAPAGRPKEQSFEQFTGQEKAPILGPKASESQLQLEGALARVRQLGGEAGTLADMLLGMPNFLVRTGTQLGATVGAVGRGAKDPFAEGRLAGQGYDIMLEEARGNTRGDLLGFGQSILAQADSPLRHLMEMFKSGEAMDKSKTASGMAALTKLTEEAGVWAENATGGRVSRDAVPMFVETLMAGLTGVGSGRAQPAIPKHVQKALRDSATKLKESAELEAQSKVLTPAEFVARVPVQQQINDMLGIRTPAEQAQVTRQRRKDIQAAFDRPAEGSDYTTGIDESIFRADERTRNEAAYSREQATARNANEQGRLFEEAPDARIEATDRPMGQAEALEILQKPGHLRTAEDLIRLRAARQKGGARPEVLGLLSAAGIGMGLGAELDDEKLRGALLGGATGLAAALPFVGRGASLDRAAFRGPGRRQLGAAGEQPVHPLLMAYRKATGEHNTARRKIEPLQAELDRLEALQSRFGGPRNAAEAQRASDLVDQINKIQTEEVRPAGERLKIARKAFEDAGSPREPGSLGSPARGPGKKQLGAVKAPGGMWHPEASERLSEPLYTSMVRGLENERTAPGGEYSIAEIGKLSKHSEAAWADKAIRNYLNKYAGTERDPLKDVEIPFGEGTRPWGELVDRSIEKKSIGQAPTGWAVGMPIEQQLRLTRERPNEPIFDIGRGEQRLSVEEMERLGMRGGEATRGSLVGLTDYLSHVGDYLRQNVLKDKDAFGWYNRQSQQVKGEIDRAAIELDKKTGRKDPNVEPHEASLDSMEESIQARPEYQKFLKQDPLQQYDLVRAVRETAENDRRVAKEMEKAQAASTKDLPVHKEYPDGFKWVELKKPEKLTAEQQKLVRKATKSELKEVSDDIMNGEFGDNVPEQGYVAVGPDGKPVKNSYTQALAIAGTPEEAWLAGRLAEEGNQMGHCVGGYCEGVASGESRIFSLRDPKGLSHVTVEVTPADVRLHSPEQFARVVGGELLGRYARVERENPTAVRALNQEVLASPEYKQWLGDKGEDITQIKGKQNRAPEAKYLPYVQDFVKSGPDILTSKGYRSGESGQGKFGATEGHGIYLAEKPELARFFGKNVKEVPYREPKKVLVVNEEVLPLLQESEVILESVKASDTPWIKANKKAYQEAHKKHGVTEKNWQEDLIAEELTKILRAEGYDAVKVTSGGDRWIVLLDESLTKEGKWGEVGDIDNAKLVDWKRLQEGRTQNEAFARERRIFEERFGDRRFITDEEYNSAAGDALRQLPSERELDAQGLLRRGRPREEGFIDQRLVMGLGALGLGGAAALFLSDPTDKELAPILALGALGLPFKKRLAEVVRGADYGLGVLSTRIGNISPALKLAGRTYERKVLEDSHTRLNQLTPLMKEIENLPSSQRKAFDLAYMNNDPVALAAVMKGREALVASFRQARNTLNQLGTQLQGYGRFKTMKDDYLPRLVKDVAGLREALDVPDRTRLDKALMEAEAKSMKTRGVGLSNIETSAIINREVTAIRQTRASRPDFTRGRKVKEVTEALLPYYHTPAEALYAYARAAVQDLETARFFGKEHLVQRQIGSQQFTDIGASVGNVVGRELRAGRITPEQAQQLISMLQSRFAGGERSPGWAVQGVRNLANMGLLGNIVSGVTQASDSLMSVYAQDLRSTITSVAKQVGGVDRIQARDFGLADHIAEEFVSGSTTANWLNKMFKYSGFSAIDRFGKTTLLNAAFDRYQRLSESPSGIEKIRRKYGEAYGQEFPQLVGDLRSGRLSERVRSLLFSELSDMQPISKLEMPQAYLDHPNGRLMYMLKTFMIKQFDVVRRDTYNEIKKGTPGGIARGIKNLTEYGLILGLAGAATQVVKDWLMGRQVSFNASDVMENALKTFGWGEYTRDLVAQGRPLSAVANIIVPPYKMMDDIIRRDPKAVQYVPLVGKLFYNWELGGREEAELRQAREDKKKGKDVVLSNRAEALKEKKAEERRLRREARDNSY